MTIHCQDCGRIIYYDDKMKDAVTDIDDVSAPPYVTESGDLFCSICGPAYDEPEFDEYDEKYDDNYAGTDEKKASEVKKGGLRFLGNVSFSVSYGLCPCCNRFGKLLTVLKVTACKPCIDIIAMILEDIDYLSKET